MACKVRLVFIILISLFGVCSMSSSDNDYCVVGAGPGGLQIAYYLEKAGRNYIVFERGSSAGTFYKTFPRHRKLISINKRFTGQTNKEFNLRHDWNSLISDDETLRVTRYSKEFFPPADVLVQYLNDYATKLNLSISYNTNILNISKDAYNDVFILKDQNGKAYKCSDLIISTGMSTEVLPSFKGSEFVESYGKMPLDPEDYEGQSVLILGRGNSAFETADHIIRSTNLIHMVGRSRVRLAWATHYVGDLRAVNNGLLDTYQLKSLDGLVEASINTQIAIVKHNGKYYVDAFGGTGKMLNQTGVGPDNFAIRDPYDRVLGCLGFKFDFSIFDESAQPGPCEGKKKKFPEIKGNFESKRVPRMWIAGVASHSLDWRKSAGGFIHGYRYTARALHRILESKNHGVKWRHHEMHHLDVLNMIVKRINEASAPYQMFGVLVDVVIYQPDGKALYVEEFPLQLVSQLERYTGLPEGPIIVINLEYGKGFSGAGKDPFREDRATGDPSDAHNSNFLHPVIYFYHKPPTELLSGSRLPKPDRIHHIVEDFLTNWMAPSSHIIPLRRFLENVSRKDLRNFFAQSCFKLAMTHSSVPLSCQDQYLKGSGLLGAQNLISLAQSKDLLT
ncbi:FAD-dependent oxidoreductase domain-containing protein 2-like [Dendronephthya gigantea]|uniref:FAD-dependent oxidoreductase domain-containing protein 2-like n=1 Tax=Dendronephthya gigantea TaxID=151771 RepID=UPI00106B084F|nr:FAD-dependent oxidoreductase domain-containing protein 2-like [Dendronephthya gigantea]